MRVPYSPTMGAIAKTARVSVSTVSRILNGRAGRISPETAEKVQRLAVQMGYSPNFLASSLSRGHGSRTIGIGVALTGGFYPAIIDGIVAELCQEGYAGIVQPPWPDHSPNEREVLDSFLERRVEGVIIRPHHYEARAEYFQELNERRLPLVLVDVELHGLKMPFCGTDDHAGARQGTEYLLELGHRVIGHVAGCQLTRTGALRKRAFLETVAAWPNARAQLCRSETFDPAGEDIRELLQRSPRPTAIFAASDIGAIAVYREAARLGLRLPEDLSVLGFADLEFAAAMLPALSTLDQQPQLIGRSAARLVLELIGAKTPPDPPVRLTIPRLVIRSSTIPPPIGDSPQ